LCPHAHICLRSSGQLVCDWGVLRSKRLEKISRGEDPRERDPLRPLSRVESGHRRAGVGAPDRIKDQATGFYFDRGGIWNVWTSQPPVCSSESQPLAERVPICL